MNNSMSRIKPLRGNNFFSIVGEKFCNGFTVIIGDGATPRLYNTSNGTAGFVMRIWDDINSADVFISSFDRMIFEPFGIIVQFVTTRAVGQNVTD